MTEASARRGSPFPELRGPSLESPEDRAVRLLPADAVLQEGSDALFGPGNWVLFRRTEEESAPESGSERKEPGLSWFRAGTVSPPRLRARRCTVVRGIGGGEFAETEHLLAALAFWAGPRVIAYCEEEELPALDGSAAPWAKALSSLEGASFAWRTWNAPLRWRMVWENGFLEAEPSGAFEAEVIWARDGLEQRATFREGDDPERIWRAPSFVSETELEEARKAGLLGGVRSGQGILWRAENGKLRVVDGELADPDGFALHKLLDLVGDLALAAPGLPRLKIRARNAGHFRHHALVAALLHVVPRELRH
ncbi:MAG: UDP-3-O-acyl-N-acetylglucosamine deacetylase [Fibrobacterales bacterium]|nr:UDP-3-O-acyl-N-acetylglucosamine deacetylase [Fibrobacterales bacterium]